MVARWVVRGAAGVETSHPGMDAHSVTAQGGDLIGTVQCELIAEGYVEEGRSASQRQMGRKV